MLADGASVIDVGAESTRPGASDVSAADQITALKPFIESFAAVFGQDSLAKISVDTRDIDVMRMAVDAGVGFINDVSGGGDAIYKLIGQSGAGYVLMHTRGTPQNMQKAPEYGDVVAEVEGYLKERSRALIAAGVPNSRIIWDSGIGFGKTVEHNLTLIAAHPRLKQNGYQLLAGVSRKSFIGKILNADSPDDRLAGTLAAQSYLTLRGHGCDILRVHDVKEMSDTLKVLAAIDRHANTPT